MHESTLIKCKTEKEIKKNLMKKGSKQKICIKRKANKNINDGQKNKKSKNHTKTKK